MGVVPFLLPEIPADNVLDIKEGILKSGLSFNIALHLVHTTQHKAVFFFLH